jgi:hypothetical protein
MPVYYVPVPLRMEFPICTAAFQENAIKLSQKSQKKDSNTKNQFDMLTTVPVRQ